MLESKLATDDDYNDDYNDDDDDDNDDDGDDHDDDDDNDDDNDDDDNNDDDDLCYKVTFGLACCGSPSKFRNDFVYSLVAEETEQCRSTMLLVPSKRQTKINNI